MTGLCLLLTSSSNIKVAIKLFSDDDIDYKLTVSKLLYQVINLLKYTSLATNLPTTVSLKLHEDL